MKSLKVDLVLLLSRIHELFLASGAHLYGIKSDNFQIKHNSRYALFFGMILMLGIASQCAETESMITMLTDLKPKFFNRRPNRRTAFVFLTCLVCFCLALPMVTEVILVAVNFISNYFRVACTSSSCVIATVPMESPF